MSTFGDHAVAVGHRLEQARWEAEANEVLGRVAGRFVRVETRRRAGKFVRGLLADLPRKNSWSIAEHAGDRDPHGMQYLLSRASWDTDGVRDDLRGYARDRLGDPEAVLVVDETGDIKKGQHTVGVQRQYTGTAGRIENAQVAVYLTYAGKGGHAMIDRELYLPKSWTEDPDRCAQAGVPKDVRFATKPALARTLITRVLDAGLPARWVAGDEVYGADPQLRTELETRQLGYVLAIGRDRRVPTPLGPQRADELAARVPTRAWQRLSAGKGAKGERVHDWALITLTPPSQTPPTTKTASTDPPPPPVTGCWWLLVRRTPRTGELAFYRCYSPTPVPLGELVRVAGRRWTIEESFQAGKGLAGLDEHQVRTWTSWRRWTLLAMLAHALLAVLAATEPTHTPTPAGMIPLTCSEIRRLFVTMIIEPTRDRACPYAWSTWRHQHHARTSHYQRQQTTET